MKVVDFYGKEHKLNLDLYKRERNNCSSLHKTARQLLHNIFPCMPILEEVPLLGTRLIVDFFIPSQNLMVEVQGEQHYKFNSHFYSNKLDFIRAKARDTDKRRWAEINNFLLIELPYDEGLDDWTKRITSRND